MEVNTMQTEYILKAMDAALAAEEWYSENK